MTSEEINEIDLFNNPMVKNAQAAMSQEQKDEYQRLGEEFYKTTNFETNEILNNIPLDMTENVLKLECQLRSGLHPSDMDDNDKELLKTAHGDKWYEKWGYEEKDLKFI